jgi:hypothetical protein
MFRKILLRSLEILVAMFCNDDEASTLTTALEFASDFKVITHSVVFITSGSQRGLTQYP